MADRGEVRLREAKITELRNFYEDAYRKIAKEILDASESGRIQLAKVMVRVNKELEKLGVDAEKWLKEELPKYYNDGQNIALQDLRALGAQLTPNGAGAAINAEAIKAIVTESTLAYGEAIVGVSRSARMVLSDTLKQQINLIVAQGKLTGEARRMISSSVAQRLRDEGFTSLRDKAGRRLQLDSYSEMLVRTKAVEARNQGLTNTMLRYGYDLVQVSNHASQHKACRVWEGKILSLTGQTPGYPTLADAKAAGLFHPNCQHAINVINIDLASKTKAYDNPYNRANQ